MQILRTDWRGVGPWRKVCIALNAIGRVINDMVGENGIEIAEHGGRLRISAENIRTAGGTLNARKFAFGYSLAYDADTAQTTCTIQPGKIRMHGAGLYSLDDPADVVLDPNDTAWVYATCPRAGGSVNIDVLSTEPISNTSTLKIPLVRFVRNAGGKYDLQDGGISHLGDVNLDTPLL